MDVLKLLMAPPRGKLCYILLFFVLSNLLQEFDKFY